MLTLYDYLPSRNAWKVRQLLAWLDLRYRSELVSIFEGEGQTPEFLRISPTGTVPALRLADGRALAESNAILAFLADGTRYLPDEAYARAYVHQWLSFEQERIESTIGALRHWTLTGKLARRPPELVALKREAGLRALAILDAQLAERAFLAGDHCTIADISVFAYASQAADADFDLAPHARLRAWIGRMRALPGFLDQIHPYALDPHSMHELPRAALERMP